MKKPSWNEMAQDWFVFVESTPRSVYVESLAFKVEAQIGKVEWKSMLKAEKAANRLSDALVADAQAEAFRDEQRAVRASERECTPTVSKVRKQAKQYEAEAVTDAIRAVWAAWKPSCFGGSAPVAVAVESGVAA